MRVSGDLSIVVSAEMGQFGPVEGKPVVYRFPFHCHIQGLLPILFLTSLFALRENRNVQTLSLLGPFILLWTSFAFIKHVRGFPSTADVELYLMFIGLVGGFMTGFLLVERFIHHRYVLVFLIPFVFVGLLYLSGLITGDTLDMAIVLMISTLSLWGALTGAKVMCSKQFTIMRFLTWQTLYLFLLLFVFSMTAVFIWSLNRGVDIEAIVEVFIAAIICTVIYSVGLLPFEILLFKNAFWRKRFKAVFGLKISEPTNLDQNRFTLDSESFSQLGDKF